MVMYHLWLCLMWGKWDYCVWQARLHMVELFVLFYTVLCPVQYVLRIHCLLAQYIWKYLFSFMLFCSSK